MEKPSILVVLGRLTSSECADLTSTTNHTKVLGHSNQQQSETSQMRCPRIGVWVSPVPCGFRRSAPSHTVHTEPVNRHFMLQKGQSHVLIGSYCLQCWITLSTVVGLLWFPPIKLLCCIYQCTHLLWGLVLLQVVHVIHNPNEDILHDWILISFCDICIIVMIHNLH